MNQLFVNPFKPLKSPITPVSPTDLREKLESSNDIQKLEALRYLLLESESHCGTVLDNFASSLKNITSTNPDIKALVLSILVRFSDLEPETSLLAVNTLQKDLQNSDPIARVNSLRAFSSVRLKEILPIAIIKLNECAADLNFMVRRASAFACIKLYRFDKSLKEDLVKVIMKLLRDKNLQVITSAIVAIQYVCPQNLDLIQPHFDRIAYLLLDAEEWAQPLIIRVLCSYIKQFDAEQTRFLNNCKYLFHSPNSAVVLSACSAFYELQAKVPSQGIDSLIRIYYTETDDIQYVVLKVLSKLVKTHKSIFEDRYREFFHVHDERSQYKTLKLLILCNCATEANVDQIMKELVFYVKSEDPEIACVAIHTMGEICRLNNALAEKCLSRLLKLLKISKSVQITSQTIKTLKQLITLQADDEKLKNVLLILQDMYIQEALDDYSRCIVLHLISKYSRVIDASSILKFCVKSFTSQGKSVKLSSLHLGKTLYPHSEPLKKFLHHILKLGVQDEDYEVKDLSIIIYAAIKSGCNLAKLFSLELDKMILNSEIKANVHYPIDSVSFLLQKPISNAFIEEPQEPKNDTDSRRCSG